VDLVFSRYEGRGSSRKGVDSIVEVEAVRVGQRLWKFGVVRVDVDCFGGVSTRTTYLSK
jgi:hypothetical protein